MGFLLSNLNWVMVMGSVVHFRNRTGRTTKRWRPERNFAGPSVKCY
ncbi:hypothetical protein ACVWY5_005611 [Bradyrhizobium sp. USDA 3256]